MFLIGSYVWRFGPGAFLENTKNWIKKYWFEPALKDNSEKKKLRERYFSDRPILDRLAMYWGSKSWVQKFFFTVMFIFVISIIVNYFNFWLMLVINIVFLLMTQYLDRQFQQMMSDYEFIFEETQRLMRLTHQAEQNLACLHEQILLQKSENEALKIELERAKDKVTKVRHEAHIVQELMTIAKQDAHTINEGQLTVRDEVDALLTEGESIKLEMKALQKQLPSCLSHLNRLISTIEVQQANNKEKIVAQSGVDSAETAVMMTELMAHIDEYRIQTTSSDCSKIEVGFFSR